MHPRWTHAIRERGNVNGVLFDYRSALSCAHCDELMVAQWSSYSFLKQASPVEISEDINDNARNVTWLPRTAGSFDFPYAPAHIARAAEEAHQAEQIGNHMSAILMARTTVEATAKDKDITSGRLVQKIDALKDGGHIRKPIAEAAHAIRHLGNDMAHGDITDPPSEEDTTDVLALMDALLREVYETTAITAGIIGRRTQA